VPSLDLLLLVLFESELSIACVMAGMCVLAGCDFLPSIPGIGLKKAHSLVLKYRKIDRVCQYFTVRFISLLPFPHHDWESLGSNFVLLLSNDKDQNIYPPFHRCSVFCDWEKRS
jgi:5'-3' exonuclease